MGTLNFNSSDHAPGVVLPANYTFTGDDAGVHTFSATLVTAANPATVGFYDPAWVTSAGGGGGGSGGGGVGGGVVVAITPAAASTFVVAGFPSTTTAGSIGSLAITVRDPYGNVVTGYHGAVHFSSSDALASLPADYTFTPSDHATHNFSIALDTAGVQSITATDAANSALTVTKSGITVNAAAAISLAVTGFPTPTTMGSASTFTLTALDPYGNIASAYTGTVHFTSSDTAASLPADYTHPVRRRVQTFSAPCTRKDSRA